MSAAAAPKRAAPVPPGPLAELIAAFDWSRTALGARESWPPALRTIVDVMLTSPLPQVLLWGPPGILLYNDGYATICGARHPATLGAPVLDAWPEAAALNRRVMETCLKGASLSLRAEHLVLNRNGFPEDLWLDVDYAPVILAGRPAGVLAIVNDVTENVISDRRRREAETQLALVIEAADLGIWDYDLPAGRHDLSPRLVAMFGLPPRTAASQESLRDRLHPEDRPAVTAAYNAMIDPAIRAPYDIEFRTIGHDGAQRWIACKGRAYFDAQGRAIRATGTAVDVTNRKHAERRQACLIELGDRLRSLESTAAIAQAAAEILVRTLACARAGYAVIQGDHALVEADWTDGAAVSLVGPRLFTALGEAFCAPLRAGRPVVINDTAAHPATAENRAAFEAIRIGALINVPLLHNGQLVAVLYVHNPTPRSWGEDELALLRDIADRTWEAAGRAQATQALRDLNASLEQEVALRTAQRDRMWRLSSDVMLVADTDGTIISVNPACKTLFGWPEVELVGRSFIEIAHPDDRAAKRALLLGTPIEQTVLKFECRTICRDGSHRWLAWRAVPDAGFIHAVGRDITAEREQAEALAAAEAALRQAQKMEAVGQLTGGIAHDFNNLLQGIVGSLDLVEKRIAQNRAADIDKYVASARASANRAVALTHRLLAFSRRQPLDPKPVAANPLVTSMEELLRRTTGEAITLSLHLAPDLWLTLCDPHQLESAILNLAINARDAMPDGGRLTLETANTTLDAAAAARTPDAAPGDYICLSVTDTGTGMPASVMEQAFEPFYTTKPIGQGTGLGLSMIYGFVRQSEGHVKLESELGRGTSVKLYLPRFRGAMQPATPALEAAAAAPSHATVLVVEDEAVVRNLVLEILADLGLTLLQAPDGPAGLAILQSKQAVDLLITDIGLPGLNGRQMADAARLLRPTLKILFMTGYAETTANATGFLEPGMEMITKPFPITTLATRVTAMLEAPNR